MNEGQTLEQQPSLSIRLFLSFLAARLTYGLVFLTSALRQSPVPWYLPLEHRFVWASRPDGLGMDWYGRTVLSLLAALLAFVLVLRLSRVTVWLSKPSVVVAIARAGALVLLLDFVYFGWALMNQTPHPWPLPAGYEPR